VSQLTEPNEADTAGRVCELGHLVLHVADLDRSLAFNRDILGWPVIVPPGQFRATRDEYRSGPAKDVCRDECRGCGAQRLTDCGRRHVGPSDVD
jgi:catechol 2,3-dioxygenase-like lactoylglutathione lyase family enzyme